LFENVQILGLFVQALGAALIGLLCLLLGRVVRSAALAAWVWAWGSLSIALIALLLEQGLPATAPYAVPCYLFGEYLFGYWLIEGCAYFAHLPWSRHWFYRAMLPMAVVAAGLPQLVGYGFDVLFPIQSLFLTCAFLVALAILRAASRHAHFNAGLPVIRAALLLLVLNFAAYVPIFAMAHWLHAPLPMTFLRLSSAVHLVLEFLLGFGGAVVVLEESRAGLVSRNERLIADSDRLRHWAERDALTGAHNRHAFAGFSYEIGTATLPVLGCVAMIDIDGFKKLNDTLGHAAGDAILVGVARALGGALGEADRLFRWGGDEFLVVSFEAGTAQLEARLKELNRELPQHCGAGVKMSFGVAEFGTHDGLQAAVERADLSMYRRRRSTDVAPARGRSDQAPLE
jgi:diguanylate cyclase (GGDEF)-like protein